MITSKNKVQKPIALALQGGGAHGAYQAGIISGLLKHGGFKITSVSGASAGSINALLTVHGLETVGPEETRKLLRHAWEYLALTKTNVEECFKWARDKTVGKNTALASVANMLFAPALYIANTAEMMGSFGFVAAVGQLPHIAGEYVMQRLFGDKLRKLIDFGRINKTGGMPLFISATNIDKGTLLVSTRDNVSAERVMASCAIPGLFPHVKINDERHIDGAVVSNPPIRPLIKEGDDVVVIQLAPFDQTRSVLPQTALLAMHATMTEAIRGAEHINRIRDHFSDQEWVGHGLDEKQPRFHMIIDKHSLPRHGFASMLHFNRPFMDEVFKAGERAALKWAEENYDMIGEQSTYSPSSEYEHEPAPVCNLPRNHPASNWRGTGTDGPNLV